MMSKHWMGRRICRDVVGKESADEVEVAVVVGETAAGQLGNVVVDRDEAAWVVEEVKQRHKKKVIVEGVVQEGEVVGDEGEAVVEVGKEQHKKKERPSHPDVVVEEAVERDVEVARGDRVIQERRPSHCATTWTASAERACRRTLWGLQANRKPRRPPARNGCAVRPDQHWLPTCPCQLRSGANSSSEHCAGDE